MLFTDPTFLLIFLPVLLGLYFLCVSLTPGRAKSGARDLTWPNWVLLAGGIVFYAYGAGAFAWVIVAAIAFNYGMAHAIDRAREPVLLTIAVAGNVVLLGIFKYAMPIAMEVPTLSPLNGRGLAVPQLLVPFGLSVFTLHAISYLIDVYRRDAVPHRHPAQAALYLLFFPVLIAGPILHYRDLTRQIEHRLVGMAAFAYGVRRFVIGLGKTVLIANTLAVPADMIFALPAAELATAHAWLGIICFTLQIYFDLSGYSDMAIGIGRMLGFRLPDNFRGPYVADTLHDFWRRWNITLVAWFRTYPALRLDGAGNGPAHTGRHVLTLFLFVGLWHSPGWNAVVWGLYHGTVVVVERLGLAATVARLPALLRHVYVLLVVMLGWVVFRTETLPGTLLYLQALAGLNTAVIEAPALPVTTTVWVALAVGVIGSAPLVSWLSRWRVMLDAVTTSVLMVASTTSRFTWRRGSDVVDALPRRRRGPKNGPRRP